MILFTISHSVFGKENSAEILVNSRERLWNYHMFILNIYTGKKKQNFRNHIVLQMTIIVGKSRENNRRR